MYLYSYTKQTAGVKIYSSQRFHPCCMSKGYVSNNPCMTQHLLMYAFTILQITCPFCIYLLLHPVVHFYFILIISLHLFQTAHFGFHPIVISYDKIIPNMYTIIRKSPKWSKWSKKTPGNNKNLSKTFEIRCFGVILFDEVVFLLVAKH